MSKISIMQLPKDRGFLQNLHAYPGHKLLYTDVNSLEPHVIAHFSQDPGLMSLYGPTAQLNDVYLFVGAQISKWSGAIREHYDPFSPTPAGITAAKKYCKVERTAIKPVYLGWIYGLGAPTMHQTTGIPIEECKSILAEIDLTFSGVGRFNELLAKEWAANGGWSKVEWIKGEGGRNIPHFIDGRPGWIYNGRGRPLGVAPDKVKDLGNRFVQSTGHDVLLQLLVIINRERKSQGVRMRPFSVDNHDSTTWECHEDDVEKGKLIFEKAYDELNNMLQWTVQIRGDVEVGLTLADFAE